MIDIVCTALLYWMIINVVFIPIIVLLSIGYYTTNYGYSYKVKIDIVQFLLPYQLGKFGSISWVILFAPFFEEVVFFGIPSLFGYDYMVLGLICWASVHVARAMYIYSGLPRWRYIATTIVVILYFICSGMLSLWLWSRGYGLLSIALHSLHNSLCVLGTVVGSQLMKPKYVHATRRKYWI